MNQKLVEFVKLENEKFENLYKQLNSKNNGKTSNDNLNLVYDEVKIFNAVIDSLITDIKLNENSLDKALLEQKFNITKSDLKIRLNSITKFNSKSDLDSLLIESNELKILPNFTLVTEMLNGQLNGILAGELALIDLDKKNNDLIRE